MVQEIYFQYGFSVTTPLAISQTTPLFPQTSCLKKQSSQLTLFVELHSHVYEYGGTKYELFNIKRYR